MRYLCLIYDEEKKLDAMPEADSEAFMSEYFAFSKAIRESGHFLEGEALQSVQTATTVRVRDGRVSTTDGPFAETKEQLGGVYIIEAKDLNDALQVAARIPSARLARFDGPIQGPGRPGPAGPVSRGRVGTSRVACHSPR